MNQQLNTSGNAFTNFMAQNPHYGYLIAAAGFAIFFLGYLYRWKWVINPEGNTRSVLLYEIVGKETMRKIMIVVTALVVLACLAGFGLSSSKKTGTSQNADKTEITDQK